MAWTYEQNFNALTPGDLNGQDSWTNTGATANVTAALAYEGANSVVAAANSVIVQRTITTITDGNLYVAMRRASNSSGQQYFILYEGGNSRMIVRFHSDGNIAMYDGSAYQTITSYAANTWYVVNIEFDDTGHPNEWRVRIHDGSWGAFTAWRSVNGGSYTNISVVSLEADTAGVNSYWDTISASDPTGTPAGGKTANNLLLLGVS